MAMVFECEGMSMAVRILGFLVMEMVRLRLEVVVEVVVEVHSLISSR
jgi:hypothetical protein